MKWSWKRSPIWDVSIKEFRQFNDKELAQKYGCSRSLVSRARIRKTGSKRHVKTDPMSGEEIFDTYEMRFHDVAQKEKELRDREYERCKAAGSVWQKGDSLDQLNPSLRSFIEQHQ